MTDEPMYTPIFRDLLTGREAVGFPMQLFWWADGNGGCDCNRVSLFEKKYPDHVRTPHEVRCEEESVCLQCLRYVAVRLEGVPDDEAAPLIAEMNEGYVAPWGHGYQAMENLWEDDA